MKFEDAKKIMMENEEFKNEYEALGPIYEIKKELIRLRLEKGLSQKDLAELVGTKQSAISRLENGSYNPSIEFLNKIATALDTKLHVTFH
ncbi:helix-turn-helix transcriptional regulator [Fusibacter paucivorans]|jgi:DNA-binding XRE family transcriptional regulator|uniref:Helix-turn-helix transcriptional regulator n=1 Tax=Fusibacter paucivorans TaxID=76009 RepID=A0ABS5PUS6_9FIRM|nr:helix-turn-helix transcriptional regulator [Fusibacter paucivorans]MBS7528866.1 helix-turn-helix transcriptional regulator [Fusibacter paucivorans]